MCQALPKQAPPREGCRFKIVAASFFLQGSPYQAAHFKLHVHNDFKQYLTPEEDKTGAVWLNGEVGVWDYQHQF
jgi:hypothetical protein